MFRYPHKRIPGLLCQKVKLWQAASQVIPLRGRPDFIRRTYTRESSPAGIDLLTSLAQDSLVSVMTFRA